MAASNIGSGLAVALFINAYFFNDNETAFEILDPLMILALLIWAIGARRVDVAGAETEAVAETEPAPNSPLEGSETARLTDRRARGRK